MARRFVDDFADEARDLFGLSWSEARDLLAELEDSAGFDRRTDSLADFGVEASDLLYPVDSSDEAEGIDVQDVRDFVRGRLEYDLSENEAADLLLQLEQEGFDPDSDSIEDWADEVDSNVMDIVEDQEYEDEEYEDDPYYDAGSEFEITATTAGGTPKRKG